MLKTIKISSNKKLGGCAATYRAGTENVYSTCPSSCALKPSQYRGSERLDRPYLEALLQAVPDGGVSWTYTHFPKEVIPLPSRTGQPETVINISTDSPREALETFEAGYPTVVVTPASQRAKVDRIPAFGGLGEVRLVRCPAEYSDITCYSCGSGKPLCARPDRDYVIKFTAHGAQAGRIVVRAEGKSSDTGGCYGSGGPVHLQWKKTMGSTENDGEQLLDFVKTLPKGTILRHHVVGDLG